LKSRYPERQAGTLSGSANRRPDTMSTFLLSPEKKSTIQAFFTEKLQEEFFVKLEEICSQYLIDRDGVDGQPARAAILKQLDGTKTKPGLTAQLADYRNQGKALQQKLASFSHLLTNAHILPVLTGIEEVNARIELILEHFERVKTPQPTDRPGVIDVKDYYPIKQTFSKTPEYALVSGVISLIERTEGTVNRDTNENSSPRSVLEVCNPGGCGGLPKIIRKILKGRRSIKPIKSKV